MSFDTQWSPKYSFSNDNKTACVNSGANYAAIRLNSLPFTTAFTVSFTLRGYGWIGLGSTQVAPDGFPGYTKEGWMVCTDGRFYSNNVQLSSAPNFNFDGIKATLAWDPKKADTIVVTSGANTNTYTAPDIPSSVYFVASMGESGSVTVHDSTVLLSLEDHQELTQKLVDSQAAYDDLLKKHKDLESRFIQSEVQKLQKVMDKFSPFQIQALKEQATPLSLEANGSTLIDLPCAHIQNVDFAVQQLVQKFIFETNNQLKRNIPLIIQQHETNAIKITNAKQAVVDSSICNELVLAPIDEAITKLAEVVSEWKQILSDLA